MHVRKCHKCDQFFGTIAGYESHLGSKGCKSVRSMERYDSMWRGHSDIWWTPDLGWDDTTEGWAEVAL